MVYINLFNSNEDLLFPAEINQALTPDVFSSDRNMVIRIQKSMNWLNKIQKKSYNKIKISWTTFPAPYQLTCRYFSQIS